LAPAGSACCEGEFMVPLAGTIPKSREVL